MTADGTGFLAAALSASQFYTAANLYSPIFMSNTVAYGGAGTATASGANLTPFAWPGEAQSTAAFSAYRPVCGGLLVKGLQSSNTDSGMICCYTATRGAFSGIANIPNSASAALQIPENRVYSVKESQAGVIVATKVTDNDDFVFSSTGVLRSSNYCGFVASGLGANAQVYVKYIVHFEAIPKSDFTGLVDVSPSPVDEVGLGQAMSGLSSVFVTNTVPEVTGVTLGNVWNWISRNSWSDLALATNKLSIGFG